MEAGRDHGPRRTARWRLAMWGGAAALLLAPWVAMRFTREVDWSPFDFAVFGAMLAAACGVCELGARLSESRAYRAAFAVAALAGFLLAWANLAVGVIGDADNPANLLHAAVLLVGVAGALGAGFRADGMARALAVTAGAQALVAVYTLLAGWGWTPALLTGVFVGLWLLSAALFRIAARREGAAVVTP